MLQSHWRSRPRTETLVHGTRRRGGLAVAAAVAFLGAAAVGGAGCLSGDSGAPSGTGGARAGTGGGGPAGSGGAASTGGRAGGGTGGTIAGSGGATASGGATGSGGTAAGGATGSGGGAGQPGTGGAAGSSATGGRGGTTGAGGGVGGGPAVPPFLTENFESGMTGQQPAGWDNFISYVKNNTNPQGDTMAVIDSSRAHLGRSSLHVHGGSNPAMITRPLPAGTNKLYVRAWVYMTRQLGNHTEPSANHETLIGIRKASGSANDEVRFGEIKGTIGTNEVPTDNISPKMALWNKGPSVAANQWACIEVAFIADQPQHALYAWADGTLVHSITAPDQWQNGVMPMNWMNGKFVEVIIGWQSFSSANIDLWVDDLALSTDRIGCN